MLQGHPTYHVKVIKLKWEIIWTGGLLHLSGLPHLPGVPHLHINRPLVFNISDLKQPQRWRQQQEEKRNNFARESHFFVHDFAVAVRLRCRRNFLISRFIAFANPTFFTAFPNRRQSLQKFSPTLDNWMRLDNSANAFFKWRQGPKSPS